MKIKPLIKCSLSFLSPRIDYDLPFLDSTRYEQLFISILHLAYILFSVRVIIELFDLV